MFKEQGVVKDIVGCLSLWGAEPLVTSQMRLFKTFHCYRIVRDILCMNAAYSPPPPPLSSPFNQLSSRSWHRLNTTGAGRRCHASSLPSTTHRLSLVLSLRKTEHTQESPRKVTQTPVKRVFNIACW